MGDTMSSLLLGGLTSGTIELKPADVAGTNVINVPATTGTMITSGDTGSVTNTMLAGAIPNSKLANSSITLGTTTVALGGTIPIPDAGVGTNQTWINVTSSRVKGTTYTNTTGRAIQINITCYLQGTTQSSMTLTVNGVTVAMMAQNTAGLQTGVWTPLTAILPAGATYVVTGSGTINNWAELR
jgi:hypothetical protein